MRVKVPDRLRSILGVAKLTVPLHTDSLAVANRDKHRHVHDLKQRIAEAERKAKVRAGQDPLTEEAMAWREALMAQDGAGGTG